ncbi:hypothetical protein Tco_0895063 [Tanacetum coccineum]|uniref:Retroviral polymerase SH3-like domain-containing protein n=1 Tax=Tanacetum coccineum TaxID=301880 RepID=A0ABQ5CGZ7_9ASTR
MLAPKCPTFNGRPTFANPMYLKKAQYEKPCLYEIPHDQSDPANRLVPDREETPTLEKEIEPKLTKDLLKKLIEKCKGKSVETKFDKPSVVRQPNAQRIPKPSVLGIPLPFSDSLEKDSLSQTKSPNSQTNIDGENLDKMKEKGDLCILVGYSTQSKGYYVYNKRTRLIVESIHLRFDEIKEKSETSVTNDTSGLVPQRQKASDYDNPDPAPKLQNVSPSADTKVPSQQELELLFGPLYDEFFNDGTSRVNKSSSPTDNSIQKDTLPSMHIQPPSEPSTPTNVHAEENNDNQAEFTNHLCTPV